MAIAIEHDMFVRQPIFTLLCSLLRAIIVYGAILQEISSFVILEGVVVGTTYVLRPEGRDIRVAL